MEFTGVNNFFLSEIFFNFGDEIFYIFESACFRNDQAFFDNYQGCLTVLQNGIEELNEALLCRPDFIYLWHFISHTNIHLWYPRSRLRLFTTPFPDRHEPLSRQYIWIPFQIYFLTMKHSPFQKDSENKTLLVGKSLPMLVKWVPPPPRSPPHPPSHIHHPHPQDDVFKYFLIFQENKVWNFMLLRPSTPLFSLTTASGSRLAHGKSTGYLSGQTGFEPHDRRELFSAMLHSFVTTFMS